MVSRIFLLPKEKNKWTEVSKEELATSRKNGNLREGDIVLRSSNVQTLKPVTRLSLEKQE